MNNLNELQKYIENEYGAGSKKADFERITMGANLDIINLRKYNQTLLLPYFIKKVDNSYQIAQKINNNTQLHSEIFMTADEARNYLAKILFYRRYSETLVTPKQLGWTEEFLYPCTTPTEPTWEYQGQNKKGQHILWYWNGSDHDQEEIFNTKKEADDFIRTCKLEDDFNKWAF
jgi:hypothetical protein